MIAKNKPIDYEFIDINMRELIRALNQFPGIRTTACCGGHKNPNSIQHAEGHWFVAIWVYKDGPDSLRMIEGVGVDMGFSCMDEEMEFGYHRGRWYLEGKNIEPDSVAQELLKHLPL